MKKTFFIFASLLLLVSCNNKANKLDVNKSDSTSIVNDTVDNKIVPDGSTAQNALDYEGTYKGHLPTASGEGMSVTIIIGKNDFTKEYSYIGKDIAPVKSKGMYKWNAEGTIITLEGQDAPNMYRVEENTLTQLDINGKVITGDIAGQYILKKQ